MHTPAKQPGNGFLDTCAPRLVYMPTNRPFEEAFRSLAAEVISLPGCAHENVTLLVVDDCPPAVSRVNRQVTDEVARASGLRVHVLDADGWRRLADDIVATSGLSPNDSAAARTALLQPTGSYGAGPNKAALVAALVGAESLHRRDSDQITPVDPATGSSPLRVEAELLDRARTGGDVDAYCVGSSLTGRPTRDRRDLEQHSAEFVRRVDALSQLPRDISRAPRAPRPGAAPPGRITVHNSVSAQRDHTGAVEMGVAALRTVHTWIPEMPAVGILGSDYFQKGLLYQLDLPVYHHDLKAHHVYEPWRAGQSRPDHLGWYARAEMRYAVLRRHWNLFNESLVAQRDRLFTSEGEFDSAAYGELFLDARERSEEGAAGIPPAFLTAYREAAALASGETARRLGIRIAALEAESLSVAAYVSQAIDEFARLTRAWPDLVAAADRLGRSTDLSSYTSAQVPVADPTACSTNRHEPS
ncbi:DUF6271 family protein [Streptomyces sp. NBC_01433]|uniref:DUF6271 family protein n=1 Tax=Streptomyces sp. NBC_01433 TaxID=2903864 RepID=UPI00224D81B8|nr:DUF6271 family protein [Streptomyces sp. NBC_01433]MCX4681281.1 DUF6271 family protein [Streptomyces sp. NBC_01433]